MRHVIFLRGEDEVRRRFARDLVAALNPDVNTVRTDHICYLDFFHGEVAPAFSSCKNAFKRWLRGDRPVVVIDNPNRNPQDWQSYIRLASRDQINFIAVETGKWSETFKSDFRNYFEADGETIEKILALI